MDDVVANTATIEATLSLGIGANIPTVTAFVNTGTSEDAMIEIVMGQCPITRVSSPTILRVYIPTDPTTGLRIEDQLEVIKDGDEGPCLPVLPERGRVIGRKKGRVGAEPIPVLGVVLQPQGLTLQLGEQIVDVESVVIPCPGDAGEGIVPDEEWDPPGTIPRPGGPPPEWPKDGSQGGFGPGAAADDDGPGGATCGTGAGLDLLWFKDARDWTKNEAPDPDVPGQPKLRRQAHKWRERVRVSNIHLGWFILNAEFYALPKEDELTYDTSPASTDVEYALEFPPGNPKAWARYVVGPGLLPVNAEDYIDEDPNTNYQENERRTFERVLVFPGHSRLMGIKRKLYCREYDEEDQRYKARYMGGYLLYLFDHPGDPHLALSTMAFKHVIEGMKHPDQENSTIGDCAGRDDHEGDYCDQEITVRRKVSFEGNASRPGDRLTTFEDGVDDGVLSALEDQGNDDAMWADLLSYEELMNYSEYLPPGVVPTLTLRPPPGDSRESAKRHLFLVLMVRDRMRVKNLIEDAVFLKTLERSALTPTLVTQLRERAGSFVEPDTNMCHRGRAIYFGYRDDADPDPGTGQPQIGDPDGRPEGEEHYYLIPVYPGFACNDDRDLKYRQEGENRIPDPLLGQRYYIIIWDHHTRWRTFQVKVASYVKLTGPVVPRRQYVNLTDPGFNDLSGEQEIRVTRDCSADHRSNGKYACLEATVRINYATFSADGLSISANLRPVAERHRHQPDWGNLNAWSAWEGAPVWFYFEDPPNRKSKIAGETNDTYKDETPTNSDLNNRRGARESACPNFTVEGNPAPRVPGDNEALPDPLRPRNHRAYRAVVYHRTGSQSYYTAGPGACFEDLQPPVHMLGVCSTVDSQGVALGLLKINHTFGGNNFRTHICMWRPLWNPPADPYEGCVGPRWKKPWLPDDENPDPERTDYSRINDLVAWRKLYLEVYAMPGVSNLQYDDEREVNIYSLHPSSPDRIPTENQYLKDIYPFISAQAMAPDISEAVGAFDDGFVEIEPSPPQFLHANYYVEGIRNDRITEPLTCGLALQKKPYENNLGEYARCGTDFHSGHTAPPQDLTEGTGGPVHLIGANFLGGDGHQNPEKIRDIPYFHISESSLPWGPPEFKRCLLEDSGSAPYGVALTDYAPTGHPHTLVAVGFWDYVRNYREGPHCRLIGPDCNLNDPDHVWHCDGLSTPSNPTEERAKWIKRVTTHELGHTIGRFRHHEEGVSEQCPALPTVMTYSQGQNTDFFCLAEVALLRQRLNLYPNFQE
jgi:hypothetical protein